MYAGPFFCSNRFPVPVSTHSGFPAQQRREKAVFVLPAIREPTVQTIALSSTSPRRTNSSAPEKLKDYVRTAFSLREYGRIPALCGLVITEISSFWFFSVSLREKYHWRAANKTGGLFPAGENKQVPTVLPLWNPRCGLYIESRTAVWRQGSCGCHRCPQTLQCQIGAGR